MDEVSHSTSQDSSNLFDIEEEIRQFIEENRQFIEESQQVAEELRFEERWQLLEEVHVEAQQSSEESHSTSQDYSNQFHMVEEAHGTSQDSSNQFYMEEEFRQFLEENRQIAEERWQLLEEVLVEAQQSSEESHSTSQDYSNQFHMDEEAHSTSQDSSNQFDMEEEFRQFLEETQQQGSMVSRRMEQSLQLLEQVLEELANITNYREEAELLPTTLSFVDSLPRVIITEEHEKKHNGLECTICLDPLTIGSIVNQLPCLHFYHPLCIVPWLKVRRSCPICRYKLSSAFRNETRQNSNRRMGFQEIVQEGFSANSSSATSNVNEPEVVVSESHIETPDSSARDREGIRGGWFLFAAAPIVGLVGIALVECFQNLLGDGRGRGSTGHVEFPRQCQQQVRMFSSGSSSTRTSNSRENT